MRLIDAEYLCFRIAEETSDKDEIANMIYGLVINAPTVEPKSGRWIEKAHHHNDDVPIDEWQSACCSVCGKYHTTPYAYRFYEYKYCPACGAKMEGAEE